MQHRTMGQGSIATFEFSNISVVREAWVWNQAYYLQEFDDPEELEEVEALKEDDIDIEEGDSQPQPPGRVWCNLCVM